MSETEKPFTVSDRRHFTPDGRVRDEPESEAPKESEGASTAGREVTDGEVTGPEGRPEPADTAAGPSTGEAGPSAAPHEPVDFTQFLLSLGAQASMLITGQGLPEDVEPGAVLEGVHSYISILEMLGEKTRGNRTEQEEKVLDGLLYELRMAYVEKSRAGGS